MNTLIKHLEQLSAHIVSLEKSNKNISAVNVGWHIEHTLLAIDKIIAALTTLNPKDYKWSFKPFKYIVRTMGKIPRGKGKAPKQVQPSIEITAESLSAHVTQTIKNINSLSTLSKNHYFPHPYFGHLKLKEAIWFLNLHAKHHLSIVQDIINS